MNSLISMFKGLFLVGLVVVVIGTVTINAQTVSTFASGFGMIGGITFDKAGNLYVSARAQNKIFKVTQAGVVSTFAGSGTFGSLDGTADKAQFAFPMMLTVDPNGNIFVIEEYNKTIRKITPAGVVSTVRNFSASGEAPSGIIADPSGNIIYFQGGVLYKLQTTGADTVIAGKAGCRCQVNGSSTEACFRNPSGLFRDSQGSLYTVETGSDYTEVRKINVVGYVTSIGQRGDLGFILDVVVDPYGNFLVATGWVEHTIVKMTPTGVITTYAGIKLQRGATDGPAATATFNGPCDLEFFNGALYVADYYGGSVRKIQP